MPKRTDLKKIMIIGSGPIVIGQAAEFDYAGTQACLSLKEEGYEVILVNSNPATIMTDTSVADKVYMEPLTLEYVARILRKERPDAIVPGIGGQTGLNLAMQLEQKGVLKECQVELLGTDSDSIRRAEDREQFKELCQSIGEPVIPSQITYNLEEAKAAAAAIGYPVVLRPAFTLGGTGGGFADDEAQLVELGMQAFKLSPIHQVLIEKSVKGYKEIEFEVMRDASDRAITICGMENIDPVGVHTGDSAVVAPIMTLSDHDMKMLNDSAIKIIRTLKIQGGCNVQFALNPKTSEYFLIEINPRVSRSSALASKASGYPIARVTAKVAVGMNLDEIAVANTTAAFEPSLDYVVAKLPRFPFDKFSTAANTLGTQMKATGEVMGIGSTLEECLLKSVRSLEIGAQHLWLPKFQNMTKAELTEYLRQFRDDGLFAVAQLLRLGASVDEVAALTMITPFFLETIRGIVNMEQTLCTHKGDGETLKQAKQMGFCDPYIARLWGVREEDVYAQRVQLGLYPAYKMVDTSHTGAYIPYFYSTYAPGAKSEARRSDKKKVVVLGAGPIRIGQGVEFDYSTVHAVQTIRRAGYEAIIINNNPETVSTDYTTADKLYFEPLTPEDVMNILHEEQANQVIASLGGQTAINLAQPLMTRGVQIIGTDCAAIERAENRDCFEKLLLELNIPQPMGAAVTNLDDGLKAAHAVGYPVLVRPSFVLGGRAMEIVADDEMLRHYLQNAVRTGEGKPVLVDKYISGREVEVDAICDGRDVFVPGIMELVERTGVHSGDSIAVYPPFSIGDKMLKVIVDCSEKLALSLGTHGLINIQYLIYQNELYVIEVNPRASRTVPYISKVTGVPMVDLATRVMVGQPLASLGYGTGLYRQPPYVAVKVPVFSFEKITDANAALSPEMKSTGEVLGLGKNMQEALFKGLVSAGYKVEKETRGGVLISVNHRDQPEIVNIARKLDEMGYKLYATDGTAREISRLGTDVEIVGKLGKDNRVFQLLENGRIDYVILTGSTEPIYIRDFIHLNHRCVQLGIPCLTSLDTANALTDILASRYNQRNTELIDICHLRSERQKLKFSKLQTCGNDYIFLENFHGEITCPESLCVTFCDRHYGIGADGIVLMEHSDIADAKIRLFNADGSENATAGNALRCMSKYLYDNGLVKKEDMRIETGAGVREVHLYTANGLVTSACVDMGCASLDAAAFRFAIAEKTVVDYPVYIGGQSFNITCVDVGEPHCVAFCPRIDDVDVEFLGPRFEQAPYFPERINAEFIRVVNPSTIKMRVWERGSGEIMASGTGACAAVVAAVANGMCEKGRDVTVRAAGGDLVVNYTDEKITLTGDAKLVYTGEALY